MLNKAIQGVVVCGKVIGQFSLLVMIRAIKKKTRHFLIQSKLRPKPVVTRAFSRALCQPLLITLSFNWIDCI